jgi:hypothetical protein
MAGGASFDQYIAARSNFPAISAALATGRPLPLVHPVKVDVRFPWLEGDLRRAWRQRRGGLIHDLGTVSRMRVGRLTHSGGETIRCLRSVSPLV